MNLLGKYLEDSGLAHSLKDLWDEVQVIIEGITQGPNMEGPPNLLATQDLLENIQDEENQKLPQRKTTKEGILFVDGNGSYLSDGRPQKAQSSSFLDNNSSNEATSGEPGKDQCSRLYFNERPGDAVDGQLMDKENYIYGIGTATEDGCSRSNDKENYDFAGYGQHMDHGQLLYNENDLYGIGIVAADGCSQLNIKNADIFTHGQNMDHVKALFGTNSRNTDGIYDDNAGGCLPVYTSYPNEGLGYIVGSSAHDVHIGMLTDVDNGSGDKGNNENELNLDEEDETQSLEDQFGRDRIKVRVPIRDQIAKFVYDAGDTYQKLKDAVDTANSVLAKFKKPDDQISMDIMEIVEMYLTDTPGWLLSVLDSKDEAIGLLHQQIDDIRERYNSIIDERDNLHLKLEASKDKGMSSTEKRRIEALGCSSVAELIEKYRKLQVELERSGSVCGRSTPVSRAPSIMDFGKHPKQSYQEQQTSLKRNTFKFSAFKKDKQMINAGSYIPIPLPQKFTGKTRIELERWLRYFDQSADCRGWKDKDKATIVGNYLPTLQFHHDKFIKKNASYDEIKAGLLNALGTDSSAATFTLRTTLDRTTKSDGKLYQDILDDVEQKVAQAYHDDNSQGESELKKILIRLTQEDSNPIFGSTIIPHLKEDYIRLKELVLAVEAGLVVTKKADVKVKHDAKRSSTTDDKRPSSFQQRHSPSKPHFSKDYRSADGNGERNSEESNKDERENNSPSSSSYPGNFSRKPPVCYKCSKPGHYATDCPEHNTHGVRHIKNLQTLELNGLVSVDNVDVNETDDVIMFGKRAVLDVCMDTIKVNAMIDSGACASVISERAIGKILRQRNKIVRRITEVHPKTFMHKQLVGANGTFLNVVNCVRMPISWGSHPSKVAKFFVVSNLQQDVLIGTNVLQNDPVWIEALGVALGSRPTNTNAYDSRKHASIGLIMSQDGIKCNRGRAFYCYRALSRVNQYQQKKQQNKRNDRNQQASKEYGKYPEMLNGRRVFYNQLFYRGRKINRDLQNSTSNGINRHSNGRGRSSSTPPQSRVISVNRGTPTHRGYPQNLEKYISHDNSQNFGPVSSKSTRENDRDLYLNSSASPQRRQTRQ